MATKNPFLSSNFLYLYVCLFALTSIFISFTSGRLSLNIRLSALNRYELFTLFMYVSMVLTIYTAAKSNDPDSKDISLNPVNIVGFSIAPIAVIYTLSIVVVISVFITA